MQAHPLPIVLVHSLGGSPAQWKPQIDYFGLERAVVAVVLPGHAGEPESGGYSPEVLSRTIEQAVARLPEFVLVGHSAGAIASIHYAQKHPEHVAALVLVDPGTDLRAFPEERARQFIGALRSGAYSEVAGGYWNQILDGAREETRLQAVADLRRTSPEALPGFFSTVGNYDAVTRLQEVADSLPVLAITTPLSDGEHALHAVSPEIEHVRIDGTSHWPHLDKPDAFNEVLGRFTAQLEE